jgi:hypothetical protein
MEQTVYAGISARSCTVMPEYEAPCIKVVKFAVENGYTRSYTQKLGLSEDLGDINLERRSNTGGNWGGETDEHWY